MRDLYIKATLRAVESETSPNNGVQMPTLGNANRDSSEIMKGNLVLIQQSAFPSENTPSSSLRSSARPKSPSSFVLSTNHECCRHNADEGQSSKTFSRRQPVIVKVYNKLCRHFAIINYVGRHQTSSSSTYVNLKKYNVQHTQDSNLLVLNAVGLEERSLKFEATSPFKAAQWAQAFRRQGRPTSLLNDNTLSECALRNSNANFLDKITEEICGTADDVCHPTNNKKQKCSSRDGSPMSNLNNVKRSCFRNVSDFSPKTSQFGCTSSISQRTHLPVLTELVEHVEAESDVFNSSNNCIMNKRSD